MQLQIFLPLSVVSRHMGGREEVRGMIGFYGHPQLGAKALFECGIGGCGAKYGPQHQHGVGAIFGGGMGSGGGMYGKLLFGYMLGGDMGRIGGNYSQQQDGEMFLGAMAGDRGMYGQLPVNNPGATMFGVGGRGMFFCGAAAAVVSAAGATDAASSSSSSVAAWMVFSLPASIKSAYSCLLFILNE